MRINSARFVLTAAFMGISAAIAVTFECKAADTVASCVGTDIGTPDSDAASVRDAREAICLKELGQKASRVGDVLSLKLDNGATKIFRNNPKACEMDNARDCVNYWLVGLHPASGRYLIFAQAYESFECKLVSVRTGKSTRLFGIPHFAPDGSTFVVAEHDNVYDNWLGIGSVMSDPPALTWKLGPNQEDWAFSHWIDNDHVVVRQSINNESCSDGTCEATLTRVADGWSLHKVSAEAQPKQAP